MTHSSLHLNRVNLEWVGLGRKNPGRLGQSPTLPTKVKEYAAAGARIHRDRSAHLFPGYPMLLFFFLAPAFFSCETEPSESDWFKNENLTICEYLDLYQSDYSKFNRLLTEAGLLNTLCAYNPHGDGYTLFLPTDSAIKRFILESEEYASFEDLLLDTNFTDTLARYHILNNKVHSDAFPYGALTDSTLTGERLTVGFYTSGENPLFKVNNDASIVHPNLKMLNGYIHVVTGVLQHATVPGYDWLQQQDQYSILAEAMERSGIRNHLWFEKYTILAEHDSVYQRYGVNDAEDLVARLGTPGMPLTDRENSFYQFTAYHILNKDLYLNDLREGTETYRTLAYERVRIDVGMDIRINPGIDDYGISIAENGDTLLINYIGLSWEACNIMTATGPVHTVAELLVAQPFPVQN